MSSVCSLWGRMFIGCVFSPGRMLLVCFLSGSNVIGVFSLRVECPRCFLSRSNVLGVFSLQVECYWCVFCLRVECPLCVFSPGPLECPLCVFSPGRMSSVCFL
ncbi:unnamed protein product, partial [Staurois parvus]